MPDVFTKAKRSEVMSRIRGHGNKDTELALMKLFRQHGVTGWRRNQKVFANRRSRCLWMGVSGTVARNTATPQPATDLSGKGNSPQTNHGIGA